MYKHINAFVLFIHTHLNRIELICIITLKRLNQVRHASLLSELKTPLSSVPCVRAPHFSGMFQQPQQPQQLKEFYWHFFFLFSYSPFMCLWHRLWRHTQSLCLLRRSPPFLSVSVAHFVFSCCFTLCFGLFLMFVLSIDYSPQIFCLYCVCVCVLLLIHLQITCKTSYSPRTWHNYTNTFRNNTYQVHREN